MKILPTLCLIVVSLASVSAQQTIFPQPLSSRIANYTIDVTLDPSKKMLKGSETLVWKNTSGDRVSELQFHLYLNAFKNSESTFMKESGGENRGVSADPNGWGWIDVKSMRVQGGEDLTGAAQFIHPDDNNASDQTVIRVPLAKPVMPGKTVSLDIVYEAKLPKIFARTGYADNYFLVGQWFPKIGVYEPAGTRYATKGTWNTHQFHSNTEFYADFGVYDVRMTLPANYIVGATGLLQQRTDNSNGTATHYYHAEDVHDFAWTASTTFEVVEGEWKHVKIRLLVQPDHKKSQAGRYISVTKKTLEYFDKWMGAYPYPNVTIVDPQYGGFGSGGMEYPTFITGGTVWKLPKGILGTEIVTEHEFGHQYFYGMLASNEFEEAWMDEGFNQYAEGRILDDLYGKHTSTLDLFGYQMGDFESSRDSYVGMTNPKLAPTFLKAWDYTTGGYGNFTYSKTAVWMMTLERLLGRPVMDEIMRTYFERWKFKHPCAKDFISIVNEVVKARLGNKFGETMNWYFDQVLYGTNTCDYAVTSLVSKRVEGLEGIVEKDGKKTNASSKPSPSDSARYDSRVTVSRLGEIQLPVELLVKFEDNSQDTLAWDGRDRFHVFTFNKPSKVRWAKVDPEYKIPMDVNTLNNSRTVRPGGTAVWKYASKFFFWVQNALATASAF